MSNNKFLEFEIVSALVKGKQLQPDIIEIIGFILVNNISLYLDKPVTLLFENNNAIAAIPILKRLKEEFGRQVEMDFMIVHRREGEYTSFSFEYTDANRRKANQLLVEAANAYLITHPNLQGKVSLPKLES